MFFLILSVVVLVGGTIIIHALLTSMIDSGHKWVVTMGVWMLAIMLAYIPSVLLSMLGLRSLAKKARDRIIEMKQGKGGEWQKK